jgi:hypothetical protein
MTKKYKETDSGYVKQEDGFKVVSQDPEMQELREIYAVPMGCPACGRLMTNWDNAPYYRFGICAECEVNYVKSKKAPEELKKDRKGLISFIKNKIEESNKIR